MLRRFHVLGAYAALSLLTSSGALAEEAAKPNPQPVLPSIDVVQAAERTIRSRVLATGSIEAVEEIHVSPMVDGFSIRTLNA